MLEVTVSGSVPASYDRVADVLSPRSVIEFGGTYDVDTVVEDTDGWRVTASSPVIDTDFVVIVKMRPDGYEYRQATEADGPFETVETTITLHETHNSLYAAAHGPDELAEIEAIENGDSTIVVIHSEYTFGGLFSPVIDRLAKKRRKQELERVIYDISAAATETDRSEESESERVNE